VRKKPEDARSPCGFQYSDVSFDRPAIPGTPRPTNMKQTLVTVLVVDSDIAYANRAHRNLQKFAGTKFNTLWKQDASAALEELQRNKAIDIILMEYYLQGKNGLELVKELREKKIDTPVILLTTTKDYRVAIEAIKIGVEEYLLKEEASETFLPRTISNVLDRVRLRKQIAEAERNQVITERRSQAIRELIVAICHEFNNPLTAIKLSADAMARQDLEEKQRRMVGEISADVQTIEGKIRELQNLGQAE
jgi:DNA-binding NarL/FixJ family response regulator